MRTLLIYSFLLLFASGANAQNTDSVGYIRYLITNNWTKRMAAVDYISKQQRERISYMWGNRSEWKTYAQLHYSDTESLYEDSEEQAEADNEGYSWRKDKFSIRRNYTQNTSMDVMDFLGKTYLLEDSTYCPDWKIKNDLKEIAGHVCMNAVWYDSLKMQQIDVWFALDMPMSGGPERLCGLPGMILEADVNNGGMLIVADKIERRPRGKILDLPKKVKGKKIKEADYLVLLKTHIDARRKDEEPPFWGVRY